LVPFWPLPVLLLVAQSPDSGATKQKLLDGKQVFGFTQRRWTSPTIASVQRSIGFALSAAQYGGKHPAAKPWKGEGPGILEVVKDYDGDTYRAIYTVRFAQAVYVLHVFQKKSPRGIETRQSDVVLVRERLKVAQKDYEERHG
jgi:phage-related protein